MWQRPVQLMVTGLTPQVVTETLYALLQDGDEMPSEIHLVTTALGAERARLALLSEEPGWPRRFFEENGPSPIPFTCEDIRLLREDSGRPLPDIAGWSSTQWESDMGVDPGGKMVMEGMSMVVDKGRYESWHGDGQWVGLVN